MLLIEKVIRMNVTGLTNIFVASSPKFYNGQDKTA